jgi:hypothetical protein
LIGSRPKAETSFCVLRLKIRGHCGLVTIVGRAAAISAGEWITASGDGVNDRRHGQQFKALFARIGSKLCRYWRVSHFWEGNDRQGSRPAAQFRDPQAVRTGGRHTALSMDQDWDLGMREDLDRLTSEDNSGDAATTV